MSAIPGTRLWDETLFEEIQLLTAIIIATTLSPGSLTQLQVDEALGVTRRADEAISG